jgi:hypothetical protein
MTTEHIRPPRAASTGAQSIGASSIGASSIGASSIGASSIGAVAPYLVLAQRQLKANLRVAATWAAMMSAASSSMRSQAQFAHSATETTISRPDSAVEFARSFRVGKEPSNSNSAGKKIPEQAHSPYWTTNGSPTPSWPRWINEPPTVQPDLFDEAIELLVDDDIKTAS